MRWFFRMRGEMGNGDRRDCRNGTIATPIGVRVILLIASALTPDSLFSQQVDQATAEEVLVQALRYMIEVELESKHLDPVITGIRLGSTLPDTAGINLPDLTGAVASALGLRVQGYDENTFCDTERFTPYRRSRDADLRISGTLTEVSAGAASVAVSYTGGTLLSGTSGRTVELKFIDHRWVAVRLADLEMHGSFFSCQPPKPSLSSEALEALFLAGLLKTTDHPTLDELPRPIRNVCVAHRLGLEGQDLEEAVAGRLRDQGFAVHERCVWQDDEQGRRRIISPTGGPTIGFQLRSIASEGEETINLQVGVWSATGLEQCGRSPARPCVFNCSFLKDGRDWGKPSCDVAPFSLSRPPLIGGDG